jgi:hypothetical protein
VPKRWGGEPIELERAAASADTPGPGSDDAGATPASGVIDPGDRVAAWLGVGICRTFGVPGNWPEGTGEASLAVDAARCRGLPDERPLHEPGEDDIGTGKGRGDEPSRGVDMILEMLGECCYLGSMLIKSRNKKVRFPRLGFCYLSQGVVDNTRCKLV